MSNLPIRTILGVKIHALTKDQVKALLAEEALQQGKQFVIATANAEMVMLAGENPQFAALLAAADLVVPDGAGVVWAARYQKNPVPERVPGVDLTQALLAYAAEHGKKVFFFGAAPGVAEQAAVRSTQLHPGLLVAGTRNGYFTEAESSAIIAEINAAQAELLFVALGVPKQEQWIHDHRQALLPRVIMGVGGTLDVLAGKVKRAPVWMQHAGLEWLYRLLCQPSRFIRMLALPRFVLAVMFDKNR